MYEHRTLGQLPRWERPFYFSLLDPTFLEAFWRSSSLICLLRGDSSEADPWKLGEESSNFSYRKVPIKRNLLRVLSPLCEWDLVSLSSVKFLDKLHSCFFSLIKISWFGFSFTVLCSSSFHIPVHESGDYQSRVWKALSVSDVTMSSSVSNISFRYHPEDEELDDDNYDTFASISTSSITVKSGQFLVSIHCCAVLDGPFKGRRALTTRRSGYTILDYT